MQMRYDLCKARDERTFATTVLALQEKYSSTSKTPKQTNKDVPTSPLTKLLNDAPRCYYNYDQASGRRPCTIDIERYHGEAFKQSGLPSCPFVNECFTRSDCLYITGNQTSEAEGAAQVAKELRQWDCRVKTLTKENTQTLRPYL
jgi:hypothetical protein